MKKSIGIFDSGIGGLTVLKEVIKLLPFENMIYLGDTARVPYGPKSIHTVKRYSLENALFLINHGIKLLIIACNTSSALSTSFLRECLKIPIVEVILPGARKAVETTNNDIVGVIGTEATIKSGSYTKHLQKINPNLEVITKACPLFVPLVEETWDFGQDELFLDELKNITVKRYLNELKIRGIDTLILGCTHYPLLKANIEKFMGKKTRVICPAEETAKEALRLMKSMNLLNPPTHQGNCKYFVTDAPERFMELGTRFLDIKLSGVKKIDSLL